MGEKGCKKGRIEGVADRVYGRGGKVIKGGGSRNFGEGREVRREQVKRSIES